MAENEKYLIEGHYYQYDLKWLIDKLLEFEDSIKTIIDLQTIHYADPIQWDITTQYSPNTVVVDPKTGTAYMSKVAVPVGIQLDNDNYWVVIFNYQKIYEDIMTGVAYYNGAKGYADKDLQVNDLLWEGTTLYRATRAIPAGSKIIEGTNVVKTSIESLLATYYGKDRTAQVTNDTLNVSGDYTLNAGDIATTSDNRTIKVTHDNEVDVDGNDSLHVDGVTTINRGGAVTEANGASVDRTTVGTTTEVFQGTVNRTYNGKVTEHAKDVVITADYYKIQFPNKTIDIANITTPAQTLNSALMFRTVKEKSSTYYTGSKFSGIQGGCIADGNIVVLSPSRSADNDTLLEVYTADGTLSKSVTLQLGHGNDVCYYNGKLYVVPNEMYVGGEYKVVNTIFEVDYTTLKVTKTLTTPETPYGCCIVNNKLITLLRYSTPAKFVSVDISTGAMTDFCNSSWVFFPPTPQTLCNVEGNIGVLTYTPNSITIIDPSSGAVSSVLGLPTRVTGYTYDEPEFCDYANGTFKLGLMRSLYSYSINLFVDYGTTVTPTDLYYYQSGSQEIYIDNSKYVPLPDGTKDKPYYSPAEVFDLFRDIHTTISCIATATSTPYLYAEVSGVHGSLYGGTHNGYRLLNGCDFQLYGLTLTSTNANGYTIRVDSSNAILGSITYSGTQNIRVYDSDVLIKAWGLNANSIHSTNSRFTITAEPSTSAFASDCNHISIVANPTTSSGRKSLPFRSGIIVSCAHLITYDSTAWSMGNTTANDIKSVALNAMARRGTNWVPARLDGTKLYYKYVDYIDSVAYMFDMSADISTNNTPSGTKIKLSDGTTASASDGYLEVYFRQA